MFVLGLDPGVRTWNVTVRKHIASGVEVSQHNQMIGKKTINELIVLFFPYE